MKRMSLTLSIVGALSSLSPATPLFKITPLATDGAFDAYVGGINDAGVIVGHTENADGFATAMKWSITGAATPLSGLAGGDGYAKVNRVNSSGVAVGLAHASNGETHATQWKTDGTVVDLGTLGGTYSFAQDIADNGLVVGSSTMATGGQHALTWTEGTGLVDFGSFNSTDRNYYAGFNAVNNAGLKAGTGYRLFSPYHACLSRPGDTGITDISPPAQYSTGMALAVNEGGTVVGYQNLNGRGSPHPVIFNDDGTLTDLGTLNLGEGWAQDVNDAGVIVGRVFGTNDVGDFIQKAFVYMDGTMYDLMDVIGGGAAEGTSGWTQFFEATAINNLGQIAGEGVYNGEIRPFVLTLAPEPASLASVTVLSLALRRRR